MKRTLLYISALCTMIACGNISNGTADNAADSLAVIENDTASTELVGAYSEYKAVDKDELDLFNSCYKGTVKLSPQKVATQVVAGINHSFICADKDGNQYEVVIYEPLLEQGKPEVSNVKKISR